MYRGGNGPAAAAALHPAQRKHFFGHMHLACSGRLSLCAAGSRDAAMARREEIGRFCSEM